MTRDADRTVTVRVGDAHDYRAVMNVLEGALLDVDPERIRAGLDRDRENGGDGGRGGDGAAVLVAECGGAVVGAVVLDGRRVTAVAVRQSRRGRGVGTTLMTAAVDRRSRLIAEFDERVRPFYESLGFEIRPGDGDRYRGTLGPE